MEGYSASFLRFICEGLVGDGRYSRDELIDKIEFVDDSSIGEMYKRIWLRYIDEAEVV